MISKITTVKQIQETIASKNYKQAVSLIEKNKNDLIELDYWYYLSLCSRYQGDYKQALVILNNVIKIDSNYARAFQAVSYTHLTLPTKA